MAKNNIVIGIKIRGDSGGFVSAARLSRKELGEFKKEAKRTNKSILNLGGGMKGLASIATGAFSVAKVIDYADAWTNLNNRIQVFTTTATEASEVQGILTETANSTRASLAETATLYQRLVQANEKLKLSYEDLGDLTKTINQTLVISGAGSSASQAALTQLGQAMASGVLRGEEFNSIMEQAPRLAKALADGLNVPVGSLRAMAEAGELTAESVIQAITGQSAVIEEEFAKTELTVAQGFQLFTNHATEAIGRLDDMMGASTLVAELIEGNGLLIKGVALSLQESFDPTLAQELVKLRREEEELREKAQRHAKGESSFFTINEDTVAYERFNQVVERRLEITKELRKQIDEKREKDKQDDEDEKKREEEAQKVIENRKKKKAEELKAKLETRKAERKIEVAKRKAQQEEKSRIDEARRAYEDTLTPLEKYHQKVANLAALFQSGAFKDLGGLKTYQKALSGLTNEFNDDKARKSDSDLLGSFGDPSTVSEKVAKIHADAEVQRAAILEEEKRTGEDLSSLRMQLKEAENRDVQETLVGEFSEPVTIEDQISKIQEDAEKRRQAILDEELKTGQDLTTLKLQIKNNEADRVKALENAQTQQQLQASSQLFDGLAGIAEVFGGKQSKTYKAMFAASKAFSIASAIISIKTGVAKAWDLGWPNGIGAAAAVLSSTSDVLSTIKGTNLNLSGSKATGGNVTPLGLYQVNERGPELFQYQGKEYLMNGERQGKVISHSQAMAEKAGDSNNVTVNLSASGASDEDLNRWWRRNRNRNIDDIREGLRRPA